jgi:hypothetical protein
MTEAEIIAGALERLDDKDNTVICLSNSGDNYVSRRFFRAELAALIRKAAEPVCESNGIWCHICNRPRTYGGPDHAPDCALIALCRAIVGGKG